MKKHIENGLFASDIRQELGCTSTEFSRWALDGRLPPDGVKEMGRPGRSAWGQTTGRAWLPETIEAAKAKVEEWRAEDRAAAEEARRTGRHRCKTCGRFAEDHRTD